MESNTGDPALPAWKGLFEWSMKHSDGTAPAPEVDREKM